jgi:hypothetical protein
MPRSDGADRDLTSFQWKGPFVDVFIQTFIYSPSFFRNIESKKFCLPLATANDLMQNLRFNHSTRSSSAELAILSKPDQGSI